MLKSLVSGFDALARRRRESGVEFDNEVAILLPFGVAADGAQNMRDDAPAPPMGK